MPKLMTALLVVLGTISNAADLSGRWTLNLEPDFSGHPDSLDCTIKQTGVKLAADCGGETPISGEVNGQDVTLQLKTGADGRVTATLTGVLNRAETTVTGKWHLDPD